MKYPNETTDEKKARQRSATKKRVQKSRQRQKDMKVLQDVFTQPSTLALLDAAKMASLQPRRNIGRLWAPAEADALREGVDKYGIGKWQMILRDEYYGPILKDRSNVDLKDKWRCLMGRTHVTVAASSALVELAKQAAPDGFFGPDCDFASSLYASEEMDDDSDEEEQEQMMVECVSVCSEACQLAEGACQLAEDELMRAQEALKRARNSLKAARATEVEVIEQLHLVRSHMCSKQEEKDEEMAQARHVKARHEKEAVKETAEDSSSADFEGSADTTNSATDNNAFPGSAFKRFTPSELPTAPSQHHTRESESLAIAQMMLSLAPAPIQHQPTSMLHNEWKSVVQVKRADDLYNNNNHKEANSSSPPASDNGDSGASQAQENSRWSMENSVA